MRIGRTLTLAVATVLAGPGIAAAGQHPHATPTTYYVSQSSGDDSHDCTGPDSAHACATIGRAVTFASSGDTIHIAQGTYAEAVSIIGKTLTLEGEGYGTPTSAAGATLIDPQVALPAVSMNGGGTIRNLRLRGLGGASASDGVDLTTTLGQSASYSLSNDVLIGGGLTDPTAVGQPGLVVSTTGANAHATIGIKDSYVFTQGAGNAINVTDATSGHTDLTLENTVVTPGDMGSSAARGINTVGGAALSLIDSTIPASAPTSLGIAAGGPLSLLRSSVAGNGDGVIWTGPGALTVRDSVISASPTGTGEALDIDAVAVGSHTASITGSTLTTASAMTGSSGLLVNTQAGATENVQLVNTAVRIAKPDGTASTGFDLRTFQNGPPTGVVNLTAAHSSFSTVHTDVGTTLPTPGSGTNVSGDPMFASWPTGDLHLDPASPLIDAGDPAAVAAGEKDRSGTTDRAVDGGHCAAIPDVGAYELTGHPGTLPTITISAPATVGKQPVTFTATASSGATVTWAFSDGASATGAVAHHAFTKSGPASATASATTGPCTARATRTFTVDATPPTISKLALSPRAFSAAKSGGLLGPKGAKLSLKLSEAGSLAYSIAKPAAGRSVRGACVAPTSRNAKAKHCTRYVTVARTLQKGRKAGAIVVHLTGHGLKPGTYRLQIVATDALGNASKPVTLTFTIKPAH